MTLTMCSGLPASGKSTWARQQNAVRVNKDDIRAELVQTGWTWSNKNEKDVIKIRDERIANALREGRDVISDDTNFAPVHRYRLKQLAQQHGAKFVEKFFTIDVEEAIRRDTEREKPVGAVVIRKMAAQYLPRLIVPYVENPVLPWCVMCDLDGTAAIITERSLYDGAKCNLDMPNNAVRSVLQRMEDFDIVYMSGRDDAHRNVTQDWLYYHRFPDGALHMRKTGDKRKDSIVKGELFDAYVRGKYNVLFVLDDRNQVVDYWRSIGLTCFQVAPGDF